RMPLIARSKVYLPSAPAISPEPAPVENKPGREPTRRQPDNGLGSPNGQEVLERQAHADDGQRDAGVAGCEERRQGAGTIVRTGAADHEGQAPAARRCVE